MIVCNFFTSSFSFSFFSLNKQLVLLKEAIWGAIPSPHLLISFTLMNFEEIFFFFDGTFFENDLKELPRNYVMFKIFFWKKKKKTFIEKNQSWFHAIFGARWPPPDNFLKESVICMKIGPVIPCYNTFSLPQLIFVLR